MLPGYYSPPEYPMPDWSACEEAEMAMRDYALEIGRKMRDGFAACGHSLDDEAMREINAVIHDALGDYDKPAQWDWYESEFALESLYPTKQQIMEADGHLSATETRSRPFRDCVQNPATLSSVNIAPQAFQGALLNDAIFGTKLADKFEQGGSGI